MSEDVKNLKRILAAIERIADLMPLDGKAIYRHMGAIQGIATMVAGESGVVLDCYANSAETMATEYENRAKPAYQQTLHAEDSL
jgi:hypothetical protein